MWLLLLRGASVRSDDPGPMESFVGSLTPQRAAKRSVQGLSLIHIGGPALTIQGAVAAVPVARARESRIGWRLSFASVHRWKSNFQIRDFAVLFVNLYMAT